MTQKIKSMGYNGSTYYTEFIDGTAIYDESFGSLVSRLEAADVDNLDFLMNKLTTPVKQVPQPELTIPYHCGYCGSEKHSQFNCEQLSPVKQPQPYELDFDDPFECALIEMVKVNRAKRADYTSSGNPFQNFLDSATQVNDVPGKSVETLIATMQARLKILLFSGKPALNEPILDTILDRAVYSVIALAMYEEGYYTSETKDAW